MHPAHRPPALPCPWVRRLCFAEYSPIEDILSMQMARFGAMDLSTTFALLGTITLCYAAWLTSIVFCAVNGVRPLLIASATFYSIGVIHGVGIWFGGW